MNFFKLYIGDYQRDTAHLSITEHGAYLLMLQHYYATEKPLPVGKALHRMLRAQDKAEREAIDAVAAQFWRVTDAGLVNDRADAEITKAGAQAETNARIAREREARRKQAREQHDASTNRATNDQPNQTPDTIARHQTEYTRSTSSTEGGRVCWLMRQAGLSDGNHGHPDLLALIAAGATDAEFEGAARLAVGKGKGFAYAIGALKRQREDAAQSAGRMHQGPMPSQARAPTAAEQRVLQAVPSLAAPHLRQAAPITIDAEEVRHVAPERLG